MPDCFHRAAQSLAAALALSLLLAACEDERQAAEEPPVRAIKYTVLKEGVDAQRRRLSGTVEAATRSAVAFQTAGQVVELTRKAGDAVTRGELLARLDPEPFRLALASAESELQQAEAAVADAESKFGQQEKLFETGFTTRTAYETALANLRTARGTLGVARSRVDLARRDLRKADLGAPFDGVVARKEVDLYEEVASGQPIYTVQSEGDAEVRVSLPETLIGAVTVGDAVAVVVDLVSPEPLAGRITEIAPLAEGVNAYPVVIRLDDPPGALRPGMSAEAIFEFRSPQTAGAFSLPITALRPEVGQDAAKVFVFRDGVLEARRIRVVNLRDNAVQITGDIADGDIVATAGVSLLHDGMRVRLLDPELIR
jgi:RND family efflux transporter MFP subunit